VYLFPFYIFVLPGT